MDAFIHKLNPVTGKSDWVAQNEEFDYHQEVARSGFADMLHDTERNQLYDKALKIAIDQMHAKGKTARVLDIGTGTGLLSMMAVRNGADSVVACEGFKPMSDCAKDIITMNGFLDKIKLIPKRSTQIKVNEDLTELCNILITEIFDTELIGEGALSTFHHAHNYLLEKDCIVIPHSATIFIQVVDSPLAQNWNHIRDIYEEERIMVRTPDAINRCPGPTSVHDLQLSEFPMNAFNSIMSPKPIFKFDWSGQTPVAFQKSVLTIEKAETDGVAQVIFMWWQLEMDAESKIILSCAPKWAHPKGNLGEDSEIPWRDHWMQAIYYLPEELSVVKGEELFLIGGHDEYSLWFKLMRTNFETTVDSFSPPICECGLHVSVPRNRIGQINDHLRNEKYLKVMRQYLNQDSTVLVLGNSSYFALAAIKMGVKKLYFYETNYQLQHILAKFIKTNGFENIEIISSMEDLKSGDLIDVNVVLGEPYFTTSILPWDNLLFMYLLKDIKPHLGPNLHIFPQKVIIYALAMHFKDLYKIRSPLNTCEGFKMKYFDDIIQAAANVCDEDVEPQPLWEYPGYALSRPIQLVSIDILNPSDNIATYKGNFELEGELECNGIALWTDWHISHTPETVISTGPVSTVHIGKKVDWYRNAKQGVYLFHSRNSKRLRYSFECNFKTGSFRFICS